MIEEITGEQKLLFIYLFISYYQCIRQLLCLLFEMPGKKNNLKEFYIGFCAEKAFTCSNYCSKVQSKVGSESTVHLFQVQDFGHSASIWKLSLLKIPIPHL